MMLKLGPSSLFTVAQCQTHSVRRGANLAKRVFGRLFSFGALISRDADYFLSTSGHYLPRCMNARHLSTCSAIHDKTLLFLGYGNMPNRHQISPPHVIGLFAKTCEKKDEGFLRPSWEASHSM